MNKDGSSTALDTPRAQLPAVTCAAWCEAGDGHPDAFHPDDQWCMSEDGLIGLTSEPLVLFQGSAALSNLNAYLGRKAHSTRTLVHVVHNESQEVQMTVGEARQHVRKLVRLLAAEQHDRTGSWPAEPEFGWDE